MRSSFKWAADHARGVANRLEDRGMRGDRAAELVAGLTKKTKEARAAIIAAERATKRLVQAYERAEKAR